MSPHTRDQAHNRGLTPSRTHRRAAAAAAGNPKGVMLTHRALVAAIAACNNYLASYGEAVEEGDCYFSFLPLAHVFDRCVCGCVCVCVCVCSEGTCCLLCGVQTRGMRCGQAAHWPDRPRPPLSPRPCFHPAPTPSSLRAGWLRSSRWPRAHAWPTGRCASSAPRFALGVERASGTAWPGLAPVGAGWEAHGWEAHGWEARNGPWQPPVSALTRFTHRPLTISLLPGAPNTAHIHMHD